MICPECGSPMAARHYVKESEQFKRGTKTFEGRRVRKYSKHYIYECHKCGHRDERWDYVDVPI